MSDKKLLLILGMHRSGTSAVARLVNLLGFDLGPELMEAAPDNPKGFWENKAVVECHDRILASFDQRWDDLEAFPLHWTTSERVNSEKLTLERIVREQISSENVAIKDPRASLLLPIWLDICKNNHWELNFVIVTREPSEVASSLAARDEMPEERAHALWLRYTIDSLYYSAGYPRVVVSYSQLMNDWRDVLSIVNELPVVKKSPSCDLDGTFDAFLSDELRHHINVGSDGGGCISRFSCYLYDMLEQKGVNTEFLELFHHFSRLAINVCNSVDPKSIKDADVAHEKIYSEMSRSKVYAASLERDIKRYTEHARSFESTIREKDEYVESLRNNIVEKNAFIDSMRNTLDEKDEFIDSMRVALAKKDAFIHSMEAALAEKTTYLDSIDQSFREKDKYIASLENAISEKDEYIKTLLAD